MLEIHQIVADKYEIISLIAKGGMSYVYLGKDLRLKKNWAIKLLEKREEPKYQIYIKSALKEAELLKRLDYPSFPRIVDIIEEESYILIIMDYVNGKTLQHIVETKGPFTQEDTLNYMIQICHALEYLHTLSPPIIYRDMKPSNLILKENGQIEIIDFGISREYSSSKSHDTTLLGTVGYAAPEQFSHYEQTDRRTDIYGLGMTLYFLLTGHNPSSDKQILYSVTSFNENLSSGFDVIIKKCIALNRKNRYQTVNELIDDLKNVSSLDKQYRNTLKSKLKQVILSLIVSCLFFVSGISGLARMTRFTNMEYQHLLSKISLEKNDTLRKNQLVDLIQAYPDKKEGYLLLIDLFKTDLKLSDDENIFIKEKLQIYMNDYLKKSSDYDEVAFYLGELYWFYYEVNTSQDLSLTNMRFASMWFQNISKKSKYDKMSQCYQDIADFYLNISKYQFEGKEQDGSYNHLFQLLLNLYEQSVSSSDYMIKLEVNRLIVTTLEIHGRDFIQDHIEFNDLQDLLDKSYQSVKSLHLKNEKTIQIQKYIIERYEACLIEFKKSKGENNYE